MRLTELIKLKPPVSYVHSVSSDVVIPSKYLFLTDRVFALMRPEFASGGCQVMAEIEGDIFLDAA